MKKFKHLILPALALACSMPAVAIRAKIDPFTVTQPDGSTLTVRLIGDERSHFMLTSDGAIVTQENGSYFFGRIADDGSVESTKVLAADPGKRTTAQLKAASIATQDQLTAVTEVRMNRKPRSYDARNSRQRSAAQVIGPNNSIPQYGMGRCESAFPNKGEVKALILLVEYQDVSFRKDAAEYFPALLNQDGFDGYGATGCAAEYFRANSNNQFIPTFDVVGPVKLSHNRSYYGKNDKYGDDSNAEEMVIEGLKALDDQYDFSQYDMDGDGYLDNVFVFYAGVGEHASGIDDAVWPHAYHLGGTGRKFQIDGVWVDSYGCTCEISGDRPDGVGTFIHEFSHVIGLPDLYDTASDLSCTPFIWSVLDYGPYNNNGCTPPNYSAFELNAMQWQEPELIDGPDDVVLEGLAESRAYKMIQTDNPNEFFLLENRQQVGWDTYIPYSGMLVWHIDWDKDIFEANTVNNSKRHQHVEIIKASNVIDTDFRHGYANGVQIAAGWCWPGTTGATELTANTTPALKSWSGKAIDLPITNIREENGVIYFSVAGGLGKFGRPVALEPEEDEIGKDWFIAKWQPVEAATDYLLTVYEKDKGVFGFEDTADMGEGELLTLPAEWEASSAAVYTSNGNFGLAAPSLKLSSNGAWLKTPYYEADITEVRLWIKGQQNDGSSLEITGLKADGSSVLVKNVTPTANQGETIVIDEIPEGVRQLTMTWNKTKGNIAIDDVKIICRGATMEVLENYNGVSTNGATSLRVEGLNFEKEYLYSIVATDGEEKSVTSNTVIVELRPGTGIEAAVSNSLTLNGRQLTASNTFEVYTLSGSVLARSTKGFTFPEAGLYLIRMNGKVSKLLVR